HDHGKIRALDQYQPGGARGVPDDHAERGGRRGLSEEERQTGARRRLAKYSARNATIRMLYTGVQPSSRVFFCSRKLRLAPQDYSPWTPPSDRFCHRSYPPASRHPPVLHLVGPYLGSAVSSF